MPTVTSLKTSFQAQIAPGDATEFLRILTEADMRLLEYGRWRWTRGRATLTPVSGYVTLPTTYASILGARVGKNAVEIRDEDYEFVPGGVGEVDLGTGHSRLIDQGLVEIADPTSFASVTINPAGADNSFTLTAVEAGENGNDTTFAMSMVVGTPIAVVVAGDALTVNAESATYATGGFTYDRTGLIDGDGIVVGAESWTFRDAPSGAYEISTATAAADVAQAIVDAINAISTVVTATYDGFAGGLDSITITAIAPGTSGNAITLTGSPFNASGTTLTGGTGTSISTAQQVIDAINGDAEASALVTVAASGTVTGAVAAVAETSLSGGENMQVRRYKVAGYLADDDVVTALMHYAPVTLYDPAIADSMTPDDATVNTRCPDATALKLMMLGIVCEEASDREGARSFIADALRSLDGKEQSQRGNATRTINSRPMGPTIRRIRGWR